MIEKKSSHPSDFLKKLHETGQKRRDFTWGFKSTFGENPHNVTMGEGFVMSDMPLTQEKEGKPQ